MRRENPPKNCRSARWRAGKRRVAGTENIFRDSVSDGTVYVVDVDRWQQEQDELFITNVRFCFSLN